jgi:hypothetical protein
MTIPFASSNITAGGAATGTAAGSVGSLMLATIGFGLLMMSAKYCEMVEKALKVPPFPYGAAIGDALKGGLKGASEYTNKRPGTVAQGLTNVLNKGVDYIK